MKKNNKGFTLVELLAIILIIAIIGVIAVPNISKQMKKNEDRQQRLLNQRITNAAHTYAAKYYADEMVKGSSMSTKSFTLKQLEQDGLLDLNTDECSARRDVSITVAWNGSKIVFDFENLKDSTNKDCVTDAIYTLW